MEKKKADRILKVILLPLFIAAYGVFSMQHAGMLELKTIAAMIFIGVVLLWIIDHPTEIRSLLPRRWIKEAKRMGRRDWAKCLALIAIFTTLMLYAIPTVTHLTATSTKTQLVDPDVHPVYQVATISPFFIMAVAVVAPIFEEWLFRGILLRKLVSKNAANSKWRRRGRILCALATSSILFGLFHLINQGTLLFSFIPPTAAGLLLGMAYLKGGLKVATPTHVIYNQIRIILVFFI